MFKHNMFIKLMIVFSLITIVTVVAFSYMMYAIMSRSIIDHELANQRKAMEAISGYIENKYESLQATIQDIYRDSRLSNSVSYFLQHPYEEYIKYRLDLPYEWPNVLDMMKNKINDDPELANVILYSLNRQYLYEYGHSRGLKLISVNASQSYVPDVMSMDGNAVSVPNVWLRKAIHQDEPMLYAIRMPINDMMTMKPLGNILFFYRSAGIDKALSGYQEELKGYLLVMTPDGQVIYDSSGKYYEGRYPYFNRLESLRGNAVLEEPSYISTLTRHQTGLLVASIVPSREIDSATAGLRHTIMLIGAAAIAVVIFIPSVFVLNYAKRTYMIIRFMSKAESGNLSVRLPDNRKDELGHISVSFNRMLEELTNYIDRVFKAEIQQQQAEFTALQARVNPHFLYNTLEVIRMRAVAQGAHDVGEMIYSLAMLFKSFVQHKETFTLKDEIENSRLYLELFRIRYKDKFTYKWTWDPGVEKTPIIRMLLQPVIENYIVHGIRTDQHDNWIHMWIKQEGSIVRIGIEDNGSGMTPERLAQVQHALALREWGPDKESFGLRSVSDRIHLTYGQSYGMSISSRPGGGTAVILAIPAVKGDDAQHV